MSNMTEPRTVRVGLRVSPAEKAYWEASAKALGVSLSAYVRSYVASAQRLDPPTPALQEAHLSWLAAK